MNNNQTEGFGAASAGQRRLAWLLIAVPGVLTSTDYLRFWCGQSILLPAAQLTFVTTCL